MGWFVDKKLAEDMMKGLPFRSLEPREMKDSCLSEKYRQYSSSAFNGANYVIIVFYEHKEDSNKNMLHIKVHSSKLQKDKSFDVEKFQYGDHGKLIRLMKKVLLA